MTGRWENVIKILSYEFVLSPILFIVGLDIFAVLMYHSKTLNTFLFILLLIISYLVMGIGIYGMIKSIVLAVIKTIITVVKTIVADRVQITVRINK